MSLASSTVELAPEVKHQVIRSAVLATVALAVAVAVLALSQGGPAYFIQLGDQSYSLDLARDLFGDDVPTPILDKHDGEYFWVLARDPLLTGGEDLARYLDRPTYRAQRIGYPALAAPWRLGGEEMLLWGLVITNLVAVAIGTIATGWSVAERGGSRFAGYLFVANPLVWLSLLFDFSDAVALAAIVGAVWSVRRRRSGVTAGLSVLAALTKESTLLGLAAVALLARGLSIRERVLLVAPGAAAAVAWRLFVIAQPGFGSNPQVEEFALVPFSGYWEAWQHGWSPMGDWLYAVVSISLVPIAAAVVLLWWRNRGSIELCAALPYAVFVPFLSGQVLDVPINSIRAVGPALTLAAMAVALRARAAGPGGLPILGRDGATTAHRLDP